MSKSKNNDQIDNKHKIQLAKEALSLISSGKHVDNLSDEIMCYKDFSKLNNLIKSLEKLVCDISNGNFDTPLNFEGPLADSIYKLQNNLKQVVAQTKKIAEGNLSHRISFMGEFSTDFNLMVENLEKARDELNKKNDGLKQLNDELQKDLQLAADAQRATLKFQENCSFLKSKILFKPFGIVSGDFYEGYSDENGDFNIFVGDATGHGTSAALLTMMFKMAINSLPKGISTDEIMRRLNTQFSECLPDEKFITGISVKINGMGELKASNAGHPPMIIVPSDSLKPPLMASESGLALGMFEEEYEEYTEFEYKLKTGDRIYIPTDGITETVYKGKPLGFKRLAEILVESRHLQLDEILDNLMKSLIEESGAEGFQDDVTLVGLEFLW